MVVVQTGDLTGLSRVSCLWVLAAEGEGLDVGVEQDGEGFSGLPVDGVVVGQDVELVEEGLVGEAAQ